jgi:hypothetical protein
MYENVVAYLIHFWSVNSMLFIVNWTVPYVTRRETEAVFLTCDHFRIDETWLEVFLIAAQSSTFTLPVTPAVPMLALTPLR